MSRDHSRDQRPQPDDSFSVSRSGGSEEQASDTRHEPEFVRAPQQRTRSVSSIEGRNSEVRTVEPRQPFRLRNHTYRLRTSEIQTMIDVGSLRVLDTDDLREFAYVGNRSHLRTDLLNLSHQRLIVLRQMPRRDEPPRRLVALTKKGRSLLTVHEQVPKNQKLYYGFSKHREAHHDADLYKVYQKAIEELAQKGATKIRVILDSELKRIVYRDLARAKRDGNSPHTAAIAERHGLKVIRGKIPVPDLRIEYESPEHEQCRVDLELATEHYRFRNLAQKVAAGFAMFARADELTNLRRVMDERELIAEIMSL